MFVLFVGERGETQVSSQAKVDLCSASTVAGIPVVFKLGGHVGGAFQVCFLLLCLNLRTYSGIFRRICEEFPCSDFFLLGFRVGQCNCQSCFAGKSFPIRYRKGFMSQPRINAPACVEMPGLLWEQEGGLRKPYSLNRSRPSASENQGTLKLPMFG